LTRYGVDVFNQYGHEILLTCDETPVWSMLRQFVTH
jgi:hypothetical protein